MNPSVRFYYAVQGAVERCWPTRLCFPPPPSLLVKERRKIKLLAAIGTFPALGTPTPDPAALPHVLQPGLSAACI